jgi:hypothetical protein
LFTQNSRLIFAIRIVLELIILSATTYLIYNFLGNFHDWSWESFFGFIRDIALSALIPMSMIFLYFSFKKTKEDYEYLLESPRHNSDENVLINIEADNGKDVFSVYQKSLMFIEAQDNYVAIQYLENETSKRELLRTTMKSLEDKLKPYAVIRCHRSFMVNINNIEKVVGNAHKLNLYIPYSKLPVPVSRSYVPIIKTILGIHHK